MARERTSGRLVRDAVREEGAERAAPGASGEEALAHRLHVSSVQQQSGGAHLQRRHARPLP